MSTRENVSITKNDTQKTLHYTIMLIFLSVFKRRYPFYFLKNPGNILTVAESTFQCNIKERAIGCN